MRGFNFSSARILIFGRREDDAALFFDGRRGRSEACPATGGRGCKGVGVGEGGEGTGLVGWCFVGGVCAGLDWLVMEDE